MKKLLNYKWCFVCLATIIALLVFSLFYKKSIKQKQMNYWEANIGETVFYGKYEQDNDPQNGKEKIEWIIMDVKDEKALLLSKKGLFASKTTSEKYGWKTSVLRKKLNNSFYNNSFSVKEKQNIKSNRSMCYGQTVKDSVFVLSKEEFEKYLYIEGVESTPVSEYVLNTYEQNLDKLSTDYETWLRDDQKDAINVFYGGYYDTIYESYISAVRPAIWVSVSGLK